VGTKLKLAFASDRHDTVGIDHVAMCVNDVVTTGARPLFFLDYFGTGKLDVERATQVIKGISEGCLKAGCAVLGGETAELPSMYADGEYDLAGFAVGVIERSAILDGSAVSVGDVVIGVASSGLHSNGYSMVRKVLLEHAGLSLTSQPAELGEPLVDTLMRPTRIYARAAQAAIAAGGVHGISHITGGGLPGNIPRVLPDGLGVDLTVGAWKVPPIFELIAKLGDVNPTEMRRTFNMGIGLVVIVAPDSAPAVQEALIAAGEQAQVIGHVSAAPGAVDDARVRFV
jgi:phosphoribosylformylglycinamidine cyclo-ligase